MRCSGRRQSTVLHNRSSSVGCVAPLFLTCLYIRSSKLKDLTVAPVTVEQEPQSTDPQGRLQTHVTIAAEHVCFCDPASTLTMKVRSIKCLYLWKCSVR